MRKSDVLGDGSTSAYQLNQWPLAPLFAPVTAVSLANNNKKMSKHTEKCWPVCEDSDHLNDRQRKAIEFAERKYGSYAMWFLDVNKDGSAQSHDEIVEDDGTLHVTVRGVRLCFDLNNRSGKYAYDLGARISAAIKKAVA